MSAMRNNKCTKSERRRAKTNDSTFYYYGNLSSCSEVIIATACTLSCILNPLTHSLTANSPQRTELGRHDPPPPPQRKEFLFQPSCTRGNNEIPSSSAFHAQFTVYATMFESWRRVNPPPHSGSPDQKLKIGVTKLCFHLSCLAPYSEFHLETSINYQRPLPIQSNHVRVLCPNPKAYAVPSVPIECWLRYIVFIILISYLLAKGLVRSEPPASVN